MAENAVRKPGMPGSTGNPGSSGSPGKRPGSPPVRPPLAKVPPRAGASSRLPLIVGGMLLLVLVVGLFLGWRFLGSSGGTSAAGRDGSGPLYHVKSEVPTSVDLERAGKNKKLPLPPEHGLYELDIVENTGPKPVSLHEAPQGTGSFLRREPASRWVIRRSLSSAAKGSASSGRWTAGSRSCCARHCSASSARVSWWWWNRAEPRMFASSRAVLRSNAWRENPSRGSAVGGDRVGCCIRLGQRSGCEPAGRADAAGSRRGRPVSRGELPAGARSGVSGLVRPGMN